MQYKVVKPHRPDPGDPREIESGQRLKFERRPTNWEGWLWCEAEDGYACWVPEKWVTITQDVTVDSAPGWCFLKRDYDPSELEVDPGDEMDVRFEESGWVWGRVLDGRKGWVPAECVNKERT